MNKLACLVFPAFLLAGCATTTGSHRPLGEQYAPRAADCSMEIFRTTVPRRPFKAIAHLNVHLEKTLFVSSDFDSAQAELKKQGCLAGADGIIDIQESQSRYLETRIYNLSATGIRFDQHADAPK